MEKLKNKVRKVKKSQKPLADNILIVYNNMQDTNKKGKPVERQRRKAIGPEAFD